MSVSSLPITQNVNSRAQLLDRPLAIPGKCVICGAVDRPVIDTRWNIDYYGVVYFCIDCLREVASILGMVDGSLLREAEVNSAQAFEKELVKRDLKVISNEQYLSWVATISNFHADFTRDSLLCRPTLDEGATRTESATDEDSRGTSKQEPESIIDERSTSVPTSSGDGSNPFDF